MQCGVYPFWFWNGNETEAEIDRQLGLMAAQGCRGAVLHSRSGNQIEYMSDRWLELVRAACASAFRYGMKIWLYDEDGYPSGNAGMLVQKGRPDLCQFHLCFDYAKSSHDADALASFDAADYSPFDEKTGEEGHEILRFTIAPFPRHVDTLNPESCERFLKFTHAKYEAALGDYLGSVIEAIYTDDENILIACINALPWSPLLEPAWRERHGTELRDQLPFLVEDLPGCARIREHYYQLCIDLFLKNFIAPQRAWADRNGIAYVGHLCCDEGPFQTVVKGYGAPMPYMRAETIPSIDDFLCDLVDQRYLEHLFNDGRHVISPRAPNGKDPKRAPLLLYKPASSIAHQYGEGLLSCEVLTFLEWDCTPAFMDRQMAFEIAQGVNLFTPHAYYYTLGDGTRNDCPPSYFFQQPFYAMSGDLHRKWTESAELLLRGGFFADVLVPYPISITAKENGAAASNAFTPRVPDAPGLDIAECERYFASMLLELQRRHIGFDLVDERFLPEAEVKDGRIFVGRKSYGIVLLPEGLPLRDETKRIFSHLAESGGYILFSDEIDTPPADLILTGDGSQEVMVHTRELADGTMEYYLVNLGAKSARISAGFLSPHVVYDPAQRKAIHVGLTLPEWFTMPPGSSVHLLSPDFPAPKIHFQDSAFYEWHRASEATFRGARLRHDNILAVEGTDEIAFDLAQNVVPRALFAEHAPASLEANGRTLAPAPLPPHPCDPCYQGLSLANASFVKGHNYIKLPEKRDFLYLAGRFRIDGANRLVPEEPLPLGNLAKMGYPYYWGEVEYDFVFDQHASQIRLDFAGGGMAEVYVNGIRCGVIANPALPVYVGAACNDDLNELKVIFANTAQNFVCAKAAPFGLVRAIVLR